jgi:anti-anti-sigma factor
MSEGHVEPEHARLHVGHVVRPALTMPQRIIPLPTWRKMELRNQHHGDVIVVRLSGRLTMSDGAERLRRHVRELVQHGERKIVLDLGACEYIDSAGVGELATALLHVQRAGGSLPLVNLTMRVKDLLQFSDLLTLFDVFATEADAIDALCAA